MKACEAMLVNESYPTSVEAQQQITYPRQKHTLETPEDNLLVSKRQHSAGRVDSRVSGMELAEIAWGRNNAVYVPKRSGVSSINNALDDTSLVVEQVCLGGER